MVLLNECFHHANARDAFLHARAEVRQLRLRFFGEIVNPLSKMPHAQGNSGQRDESQQGELPVDTKHQQDSKARHDDRVGRVHDSRPEEHSHVAEIVRDPRHQVAGFVLLIKRHRQRLEVFEQVIPHRILDVARDTDDETPHEKSENTLAHRESDDDRSVVGQLLACDRLVQTVNGVSHDPGRCQEEQVGQENAGKPGRDAAPVLGEVGPQAGQVSEFIGIRHRA